MPFTANAWKKPAYSHTVEQFLGEMDAHGVRYGVIAAASLFGTYNDYYREAVRQHPRLRATAIVEPGIGFETLAAMQADSAIALQELRVDGGAARNDLLMQFQADILGVPVVRPKVLETTALGAAYLAGLHTGVWSSREEIAAQWQMQRRFEPRMPRSDAESLLARWREAVNRSRRWSSDTS